MALHLQVVRVSSISIILFNLVLILQCRATRSVDRTPGCTDYAKEVLSILATNFISHCNACTKRPAEHNYGAVPVAATSQPSTLTAGSSSLTVIDDLSDTPLSKSQKLMLNFTTRGRENPEEVFTQRGFRHRYIAAICEDDLPFSFGERRRTKELFRFATPQPVRLPSHQTVAINVGRIYDVISKRIDEEIKVGNLILHLSTLAENAYL